ncbi:preprotein translocase subunit YajC [Enterococcus sp. AZ050]|uniref:preprotein translocase subunit YajC n=1 Tax=Enterococcus sp. AZ050 TaxID=2774696 RepID=UPI003F68E1A3
MFKLTRRNETDAYHAVSHCCYVFLSVSYKKKQQKERQDFLSNLQPGDAVVTIGGLHGVISEISSDKKKGTLDCEGALFDFDQQSIRTKK